MTDKADLIDVINSWFDTFDSRRIFDRSKKSKCGFGINPDIQNENLEKMKSVIENMRFEPREGGSNKTWASKPFMAGIKLDNIKQEINGN